MTAGRHVAAAAGSTTGPWIYMVNENSFGEFVWRWATGPRLTLRRNQAEAVVHDLMRPNRLCGTGVRRPGT
jgi:hypothetical protein